MSNQLTAVNNLLSGLEVPFCKLAGEENISIDFKKESLFAIQAMQSNDFLMSIAYQNPTSMQNAVLNIASIGLTLNPVSKHAYLIPRKGKVVLDISYIGLIHLAIESGSIKLVISKVVREKDLFEYKGTSQEPTHNYQPFGDRGKVVGVYCMALTHDNYYLTEMMGLEDIYKIRDRSESYKRKKSGPWATDEEEMMKKTVIKRASKLWPKNDKTKRLENAISNLNDHDGIDFQKEEAEALAARQELSRKDAEDMQYKALLIDEIKELSTVATKEFTTEKKIAFMKEVLQVTSFDNLRKMKSEKLSEIIALINDAYIK
tara:strand:- start:3886 stop:4836 length:951 start_codon:yes stop_codon:yes gene_type:complete